MKSPFIRIDWAHWVSRMVFPGESKNRRLRTSVREFARISWFWLKQGRWGDRQLLPAAYFDEYVRPQTPKELPHTENGVKRKTT